MNVTGCALTFAELGMEGAGGMGKGVQEDRNSYINPGPSEEHLPSGSERAVKFSIAGGGGGATGIKRNIVALEIRWLQSLFSLSSTPTFKISKPALSLASPRPYSGSITCLHLIFRGCAVENW